MAKSKVFWITRDELADSEDMIWAWDYICYPQKDTDGIWMLPDNKEKDRPNLNFEPLEDIFVEIFGITLAPGQRIKARLVIKE